MSRKGDRPFKASSTISMPIVDQVNLPSQSNNRLERTHRLVAFIRSCVHSPSTAWDGSFKGMDKEYVIGDRV
jgi:hypothetical protein